MHKKVNNGNGTFHWEIFLDQEKCENEMSQLRFWLTKAVSSILNEQLARSELYIYTLLTCEPGQMQSCLDGLNIVHNASQATTNCQIIPVPGAVVPAHLRECLVQASPQVVLKKGTYIAYRKEDGKYLYGLIDETIRDNTNMYSVKLGKNEKNEFKSWEEILTFSKT